MGIIPYPTKEVLKIRCVWEMHVRKLNLVLVTREIARQMEKIR